MITLESLFNITTAASLGKKKSQILGVFTRAHQELTELSAQHDAYHKKLSDKMANIADEMSAVEKEVASTNKLLNQIQKFVD
jgi:tRNA C32,U32 (ribose-2'-O)-methylase TrmJ